MTLPNSGASHEGDALTIRYPLSAIRFQSAMYTRLTLPSGQSLSVEHGETMPADQRFFHFFDYASDVLEKMHSAPASDA